MVVMILMIDVRIVSNPMMTMVIVSVGSMMVSIMMIPEKRIMVMVNAVPMMLAAIGGSSSKAAY